MDTLDDLPPGIGQYEDFHTIDWLRDIARDRMRHRHIIKNKQDGIWEKVKSAHDAWSGWVCVLLVGVAAGRYNLIASVWNTRNCVLWNHFCLWGINVLWFCWLFLLTNLCPHKCMTKWWIDLCLVSGLCAGIIDIGATWMSDLKEGICAEAFWLNREQCCWSVSKADIDDDYCLQVGVSPSISTTKQ